jgi:threonine synthase
MNYVSTRGQAAPIGFMDALFAGLASDGGLYVPETWPTLRAEEIAGFAGRPYAEVAADILCRFTGESIPKETVARICAEAYATFDHIDVAPLTRLDGGRSLLELFHGPTLAFKDVAMQVLARLYEHGLRAGGRELTIVCATSGDTGGAAVEAFAGREHIRVVALYPEGRISEVQRRFMTTSSHDNVRAVAVAGDFDDCQALLKGLFRDEAFVGEIGLSLVNSINIARVIAQVVYYFTSAVALGAPERPVSFAVPTGNFGDAYAGWAARRMGLPIRRIVVATNVNDIVARALESPPTSSGWSSIVWGATPTPPPRRSPASPSAARSSSHRTSSTACGRCSAPPPSTRRRPTPPCRAPRPCPASRSIRTPRSLWPARRFTRPRRGRRPSSWPPLTQRNSPTPCASRRARFRTGRRPSPSEPSGSNGSTGSPPTNPR